MDIHCDKCSGFLIELQEFKGVAHLMQRVPCRRCNRREVGIEVRHGEITLQYRDWMKKSHGNKNP